MQFYPVASPCFGRCRGIFLQLPADPLAPEVFPNAQVTYPRKGALDGKLRNEMQRQHGNDPSIFVSDNQFLAGITRQRPDSAFEKRFRIRVSELV